MRSTTILAGLAAIATTSLAVPIRGPSKDWSECMDAEVAQYLVDGFASLLTNYNTSIAETLLSSDFTDTSDSINALTGAPAGSVTFPSKAAFEAGQGTQPAVDFEVSSIDAITCSTLAFRWVATLGKTPVKGIDIFYASYTGVGPNGWQIDTVYSEFNSVAWVGDVGGNCTMPQEG